MTDIIKSDKIRRSDFVFNLSFTTLGGLYIFLIAAMLAADFACVRKGDFISTLAKPEIRYALKLSLLSSTFSSIIAILISIPIGYIMSRRKFRGKSIIEGLLDVPFVLPPVVAGLSLLLLFRFMPDSIKDKVIFEIPAVILAQILIITAFGVRIIKVAFDQIPVRYERVALTLGCTEWQAFRRIMLPQAKKSIISAIALCWAKALGEFGPILVFAGATRMKTEVLTTSVYLELSSGDVEIAVAISIIMITVSAVVLFVVRRYGTGAL